MYNSITPKCKPTITGVSVVVVALLGGPPPPPLGGVNPLPLGGLNPLPLGGENPLPLGGVHPLDFGGGVQPLDLGGGVQPSGGLNWQLMFAIAKVNKIAENWKAFIIAEVQNKLTKN